MKFSYDYESVLLGFSLSLSLFSYIFRRNYLRKKNHEFFPFKKILKRKENIFLLSASAWLLFSFYMLLTIGSNLQGFYEKESFFTDIIFVLFPLYCAYHEYVAWRNRRDFSGLRFINGLFSISMLIYLVVYSIPPLAGAVVYFSAYQSAALLTFFGYHTQASSVDFGGNNGLLRENELYISSELLRKGRDNLIDVNLTCSAFPSHVIFLALILLSERELKTKL
ncbi:MAG TPA: hypothetical protein EYP34_09460, partial [Chromatiaceae bacterium]|nr:hypothetical protein [Chromatiaceae bacterium]